MNPLDLLRPDGGPAQLPTHPIRALGIDLGTTNSTVAEVVWLPSQTDAKLRCLEVDQETLSGTYTHLLVPSAVALHDGKMLVGEGAKRLLARSAKWAYFSTSVDDPLPLFEKLLPLAQTRQLTVRRGDQPTAPKPQPAPAPPVTDTKLDFL